MLRHVLRSHRDGRHVGLRVHPGPARQRTHVFGVPVGQRASCLFRHADESFFCPADDRFHGGFRLSLRIGYQHERVVLSEPELRFDCIDLCLGDSIVRQLVDVEDASHAGRALRAIGELCPQAPPWLYLPSDQAFEAIQPYGVDDAAGRQRFLDYLRLRSLEKIGHVNDLIVDCRVSRQQFLADGHEVDLTGRLFFDYVLHQVQRLYAFDLDTGALGYGNINILSDSAQAASYLERP